MPSFGVEDIDNTQNDLPSLTINLGQLKLESGVKSSNGILHKNMTGSGCSSSEQSMDTDEENDKVDHMHDFSGFRQLDYLWLFDSDLKFSERPNLTLDDNAVRQEDYQKMRAINRRTLTTFFKNRNAYSARNGDVSIDDEEEPDDFMDHDGNDQNYEVGNETWADENLDEEIKSHLAVYENGLVTPVDIVSHLEYFYNTQVCAFQTENPFDNPKNFPCLQYRSVA